MLEIPLMVRFKGERRVRSSRLGSTVLYSFVGHRVGRRWDAGRDRYVISSHGWSRYPQLDPRTGPSLPALLSRSHTA